jgi:hypothetical protein
MNTRLEPQTVSSGVPSGRLAGLSRRSWILSSVGALFAVAVGRIPARADDKLPKEAVSYRDHPDGDKRCGTCSHYVPVDQPENSGNCQVVAGRVEPQGYCMVWADRNPRDSC